MPATGPRVTLTELVGLYLQRREGQIVRSTYNSLRSCLTRLADWWDMQAHRKLPKSMTEADLNRFLWGPHVCDDRCGGSGRWHRGPGLRKSGGEGKFNGDLSRLRGFLEWAVRYGHMKPEVLEPVHRSNNVRLKKKRQLQLNANQIGELINGSADPWIRIVCALCAFTAGRASEVRELKLMDINLEEGLIEWDRIKTTDDTDSLPITSDLEAEIEKWLAFYEEQVGPLKDWYYLVPRRMKVRAPGGEFRWQYQPDQNRSKTMARIIKPELARVTGLTMAELKQTGTHTLRRSMARALYERLRNEGYGDPVGVVQSLLGHSQRSMTEKYIGIDTRRIERDSILQGRSMFGG